MTETAWQFDLFEPGMTTFHRAGLVGLLASLQTGNLGKNVVEYHVSGSTLLIEGFGESADDLHDFMKKIYRLENGLISFPVFGRLLDTTLADIQSVLLRTFLQHGKSRELGSEVQVMGGEGENTLKYRPLIDFNHRSKKTAEVIVKGKKTGEFIQVAGWALPGAVSKHIAHSDQTSWEDSPERFFLLMCAPLGCLYFNAQSYDASGDWDAKTQSIIVVPQTTDLRWQADKLLEYYEERSQETRMSVVGGVSDAVLLSAIEMGLPTAAHGQALQFYAMRFGNVVWNKPQKTRTGAVPISQISRQTRVNYGMVMQSFQPVERISQKGQAYVRVMPMREKISENLLGGQPWYIGFHEYMHGKRRWMMMTREWREGMRQLVENHDSWTGDLKRGFVEVVQKAVNNRFGKVYSNAINSGSDTRRAFSREYDKMILGFQHCRTREALRETLMRFIANTFPKLGPSNQTEMTEREILHRCIFDGEVDWKELRDLCLLAIATYRGKHITVLEAGISDADDSEMDEMTTKESNHS